MCGLSDEVFLDEVSLSLLRVTVKIRSRRLGCERDLPLPRLK